MATCLAVFKPEPPDGDSECTPVDLNSVLNISASTANSNSNSANRNSVHQNVNSVNRNSNPVNQTSNSANRHSNSGNRNSNHVNHNSNPANSNSLNRNSTLNSNVNSNVPEEYAFGDDYLEPKCELTDGDSESVQLPAYDSEEDDQPPPPPPTQLRLLQQHLQQPLFNNNRNNNQYRQPPSRAPTVGSFMSTGTSNIIRLPANSIIRSGIPGTLGIQGNRRTFIAVRPPIVCGPNGPVGGHPTSTARLPSIIRTNTATATTGAGRGATLLNANGAQAFHIRAPGNSSSYNRPLLLLVRPNQQSTSSSTGGTTTTTFGRGTQLINLGPRGGGGPNSSGGVSTAPGGGGLQGNTTYLLVPSTTGNNSAIPGIPTLRIVPGTGGAGPTFTTVNQFGQQQQRFLVPAVPKNVVPRNAGGGPRVATISTGARGGNALLSANLAPLKKSLKSPYRGLLAAKLNQIPVNNTNGVPTFRATTSVSPSTINISTIKAPNFKALTSKVPITKAQNIVPKPATISTQAPKRKARVNDFVSEFSVPKKPFYRTSRTSLNAAIIDNNAAPLPDGTSSATPTPTPTSVNPSLPIHRISTYSVFQQLKWRHIKLKNPGVIWGVDKSREITARINDQWRGLKPHERKHFEEEANRRYESKLAKLPIDYDYSHIPLALLEDGGTSEVVPDPQQQLIDPSDPDAPRLKDAPTYSYGSPWSMFTKLEWGKLMSKYKACDPNFRFNNEHFGRVSKRMAKKWRKMTPEEKKPYYEMCKRRATQDVLNDEELRVEFEELKKQEAGVSSSSALSSDSNNNPEFDDAEVKDEEKKKEEVEEEMYRPDPPKHDMAASYHLYLKEEWAKLKAQRPPNKKTNKNETKRIQKQISDRWRTMPPEEKQRYYDETMSPLQRARAALGPYVPVRDELPVGQVPEVGQITKDEPLLGQNLENKVNASSSAAEDDQLSGGGQVESGEVGQSTEKKLPNGQSSDNDVQNTNDKVSEVGQITEKKPPVVQRPENKLPNGQSTIVNSVDQQNTIDKVPEVGQIAEDERSVGQNLEKKLSVVQSSEDNKLPNDQSTDELPNGTTIITSTSDNESLLRVDQKRPEDKSTDDDDVVLPVELQNTTNTNDKVPEVGQTPEDDKLSEVQSTNDNNKLPNGIDNEQLSVADQNSRDILSVVQSTDDVDPVIDTDAKLPEVGQTIEPSLDNQNNTEEDKQSPENPITNNDNNKVLDEVGQITEENERPVDQSTEEKLPVVQNTENTELPNTTQSTENELQVNKISQDNDVSRSTDDNLVDTTELDHSTEDQLDPLDQNSTGDKRSDDQIAQDPVPVVQTPVNDNLSVDDQISKKNVPTVDQTLEDNLPIADQTPVDVLPVVVPRTDDQQISNVLETSEEIEEATQSDQSSTTKNSNKPQLLNSKMAEKIEQFRKLNAKFKALKATTTKNSSSTGSAFNNKASTSKTTTSTSGSEVPEESEDFDDDSFSFGSLPGDDFDYDNYDFDNSGDDGDEEEDGNDDDELSIEGRESTSKPETPSKRNLTPRQLEVRREQNRARWAALAPEERAAVNALKRTRFAAKNLGSGTSGGEEPPETESTDEYMRGYMRKYMRDRRSAETDKQHRRRLDKSKEYAQRKKLMRLAGFETDEEREKRLAKNRRTVEKRKEMKAAATSSASESSSSLSSGLDSTNTHAQTFGSTTPVLEYRITTSSETSITLKSTKLHVVATSTITSDGALDSTTPSGNFTAIPNGKVSESVAVPTIDDDDEDVGDVSDFGDAPMGYDDDDSGEDYHEDKDEEASKSASTEVATSAVVVETKIDTTISGCDDEENNQEKKEEIPPFMEDSGEETEIDDQPEVKEVENNTEKLLEEENSQVKEVLEKDASPEVVDKEKHEETNIKATNIEEQQSPKVTEKVEDLEIINKRKEIEEKDNNNTEKLLEEEKLKEVLDKEQAPQEVVDDEEVAAKQMYEKVFAQIDGNSTTQPDEMADKEDTEDNEKVSESSPKEHHHHQNKKGHKRKKKHSQKEHKHEQPKKPRGRPRKYPKPEVVIEKEDNDDDATDIDDPVIDEVTPPPPPPPPVVLPVKRGRGRPRKHPLPTPAPLPIVVLQQLTSAIISIDQDKVPDKDEAIREKVSENLQILPSEKVLLSEKKPEKDRVILEKVSENRDQVLPGGKVSEKVPQIQEKVPEKDEIIPEKVSDNLQIRPSEKVPENRDQVLPGEKLPVKVPQVQEKVPEKIVDMDNSLNNLDLGVDVPMLMDDDVLNRTMEEIFSTDNPFNSNSNAQQSLAFQPPPPPPPPQSYQQQPHQQHHHQPPPPLPFQQYPMPLPNATSTNNQQPHYINGVCVNSAYNSTPSASYSHHHNPYSMYPQEYSSHHQHQHQGYYDHNQQNQQQSHQQQQHWNANSGSYGSTGFPGSGYGSNMFGFVDPNSVPNSVIQSQSSSPFQQPPIETMMNVPPIGPNSAFSNGYGQHGPFMHAVTPMSSTGSPAHSYGSNGSSSMNTVPLSTAASPNVSTSHLAITNSYNGSSNGPSINAVPLSTASPSVSSNLLSNGYDGHSGPSMHPVTSLSSTASYSNTSSPVSTPVSTTNLILPNGYPSNGSSMNTVPPSTASTPNTETVSSNSHSLSTVSPNSNNTVLTLSSTNHILPNGSSNGSFMNPVPLGTPSTTSTNTITSCTSTITTASTIATSPTPSTPLNGHHRIEGNVNNETSNIETVTVALSPTVPIANTFAPFIPTPVVKRGRGRPRKYPQVVMPVKHVFNPHASFNFAASMPSPSAAPQPATEAVAADATTTPTVPVKRGRGRPRKHPLPAPPAVVAALEQEKEKLMPKKKKKVIIDYDDNEKPSKSSRSSTRKASIDDSQSSSSSQPSTPKGGKGSKMTTKMPNETEEEFRERKRTYMREYQRARRATETPEEKRKRLDQVRLYEERRKLKRLAGLETEDEKVKRLKKNQRIGLLKRVKRGRKCKVQVKEEDDEDEEYSTSVMDDDNDGTTEEEEELEDTKELTISQKVSEKEDIEKLTGKDLGL